MSGLPRNLYKQCCDIFQRSSAFASNEALQSVFVDERVNQWCNELPQTFNRADRVEQTISLLYTKYNAVEENGLVLLTHVLRDRLNHQDICYRELTALAQQLELTLKPTSLHTHIVTDSHPVSSGTHEKPHRSQGLNSSLIEYLESAIAKDGGDAVDARNSQGQVNKPSGPVDQHFGNNSINIEQLHVHFHDKGLEEGSTTVVRLSNSLDNSLRPFLRTIEDQERTISQYRGIVENRIKREIERVVDLINTHQLKQAISQLERIRDEELSNFSSLDEVDSGLQESIYRLLGLCHLRMGDFATAWKNIEIAKSIATEDWKINLTLLEYYINTGNHEPAVQIAHKLLEVDSTCIAAHNALAVIQLREKKFRAVVEYYQSLPLADQDSSTQSILFFAYMQLGELLPALEKARKFVELEPKLPYAYETLGNAYLAMAQAPARKHQYIHSNWLRVIIDKENLGKAIEYYQKALKLYPDLEQPYESEALRINLASALAAGGQLAEALKTVEENLENISEPSIDNFELKAQIEDELGETEHALGTCLDAAQRFSDNVQMMINVAGLYLNKGQPDKAREWLNQAEMNCGDPKTLTFVQVIRSKTYLFQNDQGLAWSSLQRIPETERDTDEAHLATGDYFSHFKNYTEAETCYLRALSKEPGNFIILGKLIAFYRELQQWDKALEYAQRVVEIANTPIAYVNYAQLLMEANKPSKALSALQRAGDLGLEVSAHYKSLKAMCSQQLRQFPAAIKLYEEVLRDVPNDLAAMYNQALCYARLGQRREAIRTFVKAEELSPDQVPIHTALAQLYQMEGQREKAYDYAKRALVRANDNPDMHLFFFNVAHFCGYEEEAAKVLMEVPKRFPEYQTLKVLPEEQARQIIVSSQERYDQTKRFYQSGNLPLPIVAKWLSKPLPLLWRIFSYDADVKLLSAIGSYEEQQNSYSTANQASQIVIDYSALITLYYSGLMDLPQELFDSVYIPQGTFDQIQADILRLTQSIAHHRANLLVSLQEQVYQHPKFQRQSEWINDSLILDAQQREFINFHVEQDILLARRKNAVYLLDDPRILENVAQVLPGKVLTIKDLLDYFFHYGRLRKSDYQDACDYLIRTGQQQSCGFANFGASHNIVVSYIALETLSRINLLALVLSEFDNVYISQPALTLLAESIREFEFYRQTLEDLKKLESMIKTNAVYIIRATSSTESLNVVLDEEETLDSHFTDTFTLARELDIVLWTDDLASRKLAMTSKLGPVATFDTRIVLDVALSGGKIGRDIFGGTVLKLLKWNYHFVHVNAALIYWAIEQHSFHENEDVDLLLKALDDSINNSYQEVLTLSDQGIPLEQLEQQFDLFLSNVRVYANLLVNLWGNIPSTQKYHRSKWAAFIFGRVENMTFALRLVDYLVLLCLPNFLHNSSNEQLDHFLVFCASPFTLPSRDLVDHAILLILEQLYSQGSYSDKQLSIAARLLNNLREGQHSRILRKFREQAPQDYFKAIQERRRSVKDNYAQP